MMMVVESIKLEVSKWAATSKHFRGNHLLDIYQGWMACDSLQVKINPGLGAAKELPLRGYFKLNFDNLAWEIRDWGVLVEWGGILKEIYVMHTLSWLDCVTPL